MAFENPGKIISRPAGADLSAHQHKFVKLNTSGQIVAIAAATDRPVGILQDKPNAAGAHGQIMLDGVSKLQADAVLTAGVVIGPSADGQADAKVAGTDTTEYAVGMTLEASGAAGGKIAVVFDCKNPHRAA